MSLLPSAILYRDGGLSVIGSSKKGSVITWKEYKKRFPTENELKSLLKTKAFSMLAINIPNPATFLPDNGDFSSSPI